MSKIVLFPVPFFVSTTGKDTRWYAAVDKTTGRMASKTDGGKAIYAHSPAQLETIISGAKGLTDELPQGFKCWDVPEALKPAAKPAAVEEGRFVLAGFASQAGTPAGILRPAPGTSVLRPAADVAEAKVEKARTHRQESASVKMNMANLRRILTGGAGDRAKAVKGLKTAWEAYSNACVTFVKSNPEAAEVYQMTKTSQALKAEVIVVMREANRAEQVEQAAVQELAALKATLELPAVSGEICEIPAAELEEVPLVTVQDFSLDLGEEQELAGGEAAIQQVAGLVHQEQTAAAA